jgi:hypothetical protein
MTVIFPDIEPHIVSFIEARFDSIGTTLTSDVYVATIKAPADETPVPTKQVIVTANYETTLDWVRRSATVVFDIFADNYADASDLANLVGAIITDIPDDPIKRAIVVVGPIRVREETTSEHRKLSVDLIVKGTTL